MKSTRRHELKTNELSAQLQRTSEFLQKNGTTVIIAGVVVVVLVVGIAMFRSNAAQTRMNGWEAVFNSNAVLPQPTDPNYVDDTLTYWNRVLEDFSEPMLQLTVHTNLGDFCLAQAPKSDSDEEKKKLLDTAERCATYLLDHATPRSPFRATGLNWKSVIEQNRFAMDGDPAHKVKSEGYLEQLRGDSNFGGTAVQTDVITRLETFDTLWEPVVYADPPPVAPIEPPAGLTPVVPPTEAPESTEPPASDNPSEAPADTPDSQGDGSGGGGPDH